MKMRLQKIIANAGIASRRKAEEMIAEGRVTINGKVVTKSGFLCDPKETRISIDGKLLKENGKKIYIILNKPRGYISTVNDPQKRPTVVELVKPLRMRVFPVGRLDYDAEGVILLTNDGEFAERIIHPRFRIPRTYVVKVKGFPGLSAIAALRRGIRLSDGMSAPARVRVVDKTKRNAWVRITVIEGRNRLIKRMFEAAGHPVLKLKRVKLGPFSLGHLKPGEYMLVSPQKIALLFRGTERLKEDA
ncbi:MAG: rRNA pseudouridine synthase [Deltaproteobacteria bacterium]|nr:rRNA pseudouridine synthase [Deltaproteobacteria bacterium]